MIQQKYPRQRKDEKTMSQLLTCQNKIPDTTNLIEGRFILAYFRGFSSQLTGSKAEQHGREDWQQGLAKQKVPMAWQVGSSKSSFFFPFYSIQVTSHLVVATHTHSRSSLFNQSVLTCKLWESNQWVNPVSSWKGLTCECLRLCGEDNLGISHNRRAKYFVLSMGV